MTALLRALAATHAPEAAAVPPLAPGDVVGRFELLRVVGRGGFGVVFEARDRELGRSVAFKLVHPTLRALEGQLLHEAETVARLSHPNVITLHDLGRTAQGPYLVLEFLTGETLQARLERGPLPLGEALRVAVEVARGLAYAHGEGVLHRDLKPANVFLCDRGAVKVLDFGLALAFERRALSGGTPAYMAPEQWAEAPEDQRTDVFALGVLIHRMVSGTLPFREKHAWSAGGRAAPPLDTPGAPALGSLVARMLTLDPAGRPAGGAEVLAALEAVQRDLAARPAPIRGRRLRLVGAAALALTLLGGALLAGRSLGGRDGAVEPAAVPGVAVLPFEDLSPERDQEYLSDGVAEQVLDALAELQGLRVPGRASTFWFKGRGAAPAEIGRRLGVTHLLTGTVRRSEERLRVTAELVRAADGVRLWSQAFDRAPGELAGVEDAIAGEVAGALRARLLPGLAAPAPAARAADPEVHRLYLLGRHLVAHATPGDLEAGVRALERAVALDPGHAPARVWLTYATWERVNLGPPPGEPAGPAFDTITAGAAALREADALVALAPGLADAAWLRGYFRSVVSWDWSGALADYQRALALDPRDTRTRLDHAGMLAVMGRVAEARDLAARAAADDPLDPDVHRWLGDFQLAAGDRAAAIASFRRGLEAAPDHTYLRRELGLALLLAGRAAEALEVFRPHPVPWMRDLGLALAHHALGDDPASRQALARLAAVDPALPAYQVAEVHAWRGERDEAFRWLERARQLRDPGMNYLLFDPLLAGLRADPRFDALRGRLGLPAAGGG